MDELIIRPGPPLATSARDARRSGVCDWCGGLVGVGQRVADVAGVGAVHASCVVKIADGAERPPGPSVVARKRRRR